MKMSSEAALERPIVKTNWVAETRQTAGDGCILDMTYVVTLHEARVALERYPVGGTQSIRVCLGRRQGTYISDVETGSSHRVSDLHRTWRVVTYLRPRLCG